LERGLERLDKLLRTYDTIVSMAGGLASHSNIHGCQYIILGRQEQRKLRMVDVLNRLFDKHDFLEKIKQCKWRVE
jgi:hypothetical protein